MDKPMSVERRRMPQCVDRAATPKAGQVGYTRQRCDWGNGDQTQCVADIEINAQPRSRILKAELRAALAALFTADNSTADNSRYRQRCLWRMNPQSEGGSPQVKLAGGTISAVAVVGTCVATVV
jgi:hypothetical protein